MKQWLVTIQFEDSYQLYSNTSNFFSKNEKLSLTELTENSEKEMERILDHSCRGKSFSLIFAIEVE